MKPLQYYLAGGWSHRPQLITLATDLDARTGWTCNARWLRRDQRDEEHPDKRREAALENVTDVLNAYALVHVDKGTSTNGGRCFEAGIAATAGIPLIWLHPNSTPGNVFALLPTVMHARNVQQAADHLLSLDTDSYYGPSLTTILTLKKAKP